MFGAMRFDLAERLQTPVFVMTDLDIGMNDWVVEPLDVGRQRASYDRGKVHDAERLEAGKRVRPLPRCRRRRHSATARCPARIPSEGRLLHPRARRTRTPAAILGGRSGYHATTWSG